MKTPAATFIFASAAAGRCSPGAAEIRHRRHICLRGDEPTNATELALGQKFRPQSYHDFIVAQGLLPPELLEKAVMEGYVKPLQSAAAQVRSD